MQQILKDAICEPDKGKSIIRSKVIVSSKTRTTCIQMVTKADSSTDATSIGWLQGSNDNITWFNIAKLTTTGTGVQSDGGPFEALWAYMRFRLESTTENCPVDVYLTQREG